MLKFDGRTVIVTGSGTGIGLSHAQLFASRGANVVINDINESAANSAVAKIGVAAVSCVSDITTDDGARTLIDFAIKNFGRIDTVINNAGILQSCDFGEMDVEIWDRVVNTNLRGSFLVTQKAWSHLINSGSGTVVFTTSNSGLLGIPGSSAYASSKAALWGLTRTLAIEGSELGIRVNAIAPMAYTSMAINSRTAPESWRTGQGDEWSRRLTPESVSAVVAWLSHPECPLNGEILSAAAGRVARFFMGLTSGFAEDDLQVEDIPSEIDKILDTSEFVIHQKAADESRALYKRLMFENR